MDKLHKKSNTKLGDTSSGLTEERAREIAREEIERYFYEKYLGNRQARRQSDVLISKLMEGASGNLKEVKT
jgi:hypothetical protein